MNCDAVAREASVDPTIRLGAMVLFTVALIESRAFVLRHYWSRDAEASRKGDVYFSA